MQTVLAHGSVQGRLARLKAALLAKPCTAREIESAAMILQQAEQIEQLEVERLRLAGERLKQTGCSMTSIPTRKIEMKTVQQMLDLKPTTLCPALYKWSIKAAAMLRQQAEQIEQLEVERLRLAGEVSNRNIRALEGDKSAAAFNTLYDEFETLRAALTASYTSELDELATRNYSLRKENESLKADAERYRWLTVNAYVGIAPHPKPHEVWCLRLPNPTGCTTLDAAIDAMKGAT